MSITQIIYVGLVLLQACGVDFEVKAYLSNVADSPDEIEKKYVCPQSNHQPNRALHSPAAADIDG